MLQCYHLKLQKGILSGEWTDHHLLPPNAQLTLRKISCEEDMQIIEPTKNIKLSLTINYDFFCLCLKAKYTYQGLKPAGSKRIYYILNSLFNIEQRQLTANKIKQHHVPSLPKTAAASKTGYFRHTP